MQLGRFDYYLIIINVIGFVLYLVIQEYNRDNEDLYCLCLDDSIFGERQWQIADNMI